MNLRVILFCCLFLVSGFRVSYAQQDNSNKIYKLSHPLKYGSENNIRKITNYDRIADTLKVVAILVQFQEDNTGLTTGNGKFDLSSKYYNASLQRDTVIDSPPYDSAYFADHLRFMKNYFEKSSKGETVLNYELFGQVITLPKKMEEYSPRNNEPFNKLGDLYKDAWTLADGFINFSGYDPAKTAFVIFHAGTGRDVDLQSILGFDPTPYDIPSVYLGLNNLREFYGSTYNGYQTGEGIFIQNSLIIPSTELREVNSIGGNVLIELGINGILCASFGSYLGLPDLFNTSNGKTAIGRFGLMDGQSIFSFNGIFPPEPSAWEKMYLGWVTPIVVSSGEADYRIKTSSFSTPSDSTIFKVLISSKEYYLIENRNRDPENDGQKIYTRNRNFNDSNIYTSDQDGFQYFDVTKIDGNVTDVQTFDWSLPGFIDANNYYKGGILIWHIDENVIDAKIGTNTINNDLNHQGVDLKEAKGAQTIGVTFSSPFGEITGDGTPYDYWYRGDHQVPAAVYKNEFTPTSTPNSLSYSLANNNIFITNFDTIKTVMSFHVRIGGNVSPIAGFPKFIGKDSSGNSQPIAFDFVDDTSDEIFLNANGVTYGFKKDGTGANGNPAGNLADYGRYIPGFVSSNTLKYVISIKDSSLVFIDNAFVQTPVNWNDSKASAPFFINDATDFVYVGKESGRITKYRFNLDRIPVDSANSSIRQFAVTSADTFAYATNAYKYLTVGNILSNTSVDTLKVTANNEILVNGNKVSNNYSFSDIHQSPVLADINRDGRQEILFVADKKIYALNSQGVLLDNFPINKDVTSGLSVADVNSDNIFDIIFSSSNGDLFAYGINGKVVPGFPIKAGANSTSTPALANINDTLAIFVYGGDGYLYGYKTFGSYNETNILWKNYLKDKYHSNNNFQAFTSQTSFSGKLPDDRVYNWPNPVYSNSTFIRYYLNGSASSVKIKITDLTGELITTLDGTAFANSDNEVVWNVSQVQSGIYYGIVEADVDGSKESKVIKIAVVK